MKQLWFVLVLASLSAGIGQQPDGAAFWETMRKADRMEDRQQALAVLEAARVRFPGREFEVDSEIAFACAHLGQYEKSMEIWESGHKQGFFYGLFPQFDLLKPFEKFPRFQLLVERDKELREKAERAAVMRYEVVTPEGYSPSRKYPLFLVLHAGMDNIEHARSYWTSKALGREYLVAYIQSARPMTSKTYGWRAGDTEMRAGLRKLYGEIVAQYPVDTSRILIGGMSAGGFMSLDVLVHDILPVTGYVVNCPGVPPDFEASMADRIRQRGARGVIITGEKDFGLSDLQAMIEVFKKAGVMHRFVVIPGMGHDVPDDFSSRLDAALSEVGGSPAAAMFVPNGQELNRLAARGVALADFNGDGFLDAFVVNENTPEGSGFRLYFGDGHGRFRDSGAALPNPGGFGTKPAVGDVNGDGKTDVITGGTVWLNDGKGVLTAHPELIPKEDSSELRAVRLADVNGDGFPDLVAIADWRVLRVYLNDGHGHFRDTHQRLGAGIMGPLALGDVDGNGTIDAVTGGWKADGSSYIPTRVWLNDGQGNFRDSGQAFDEGDHHVHGVTLGDLNGDGHPDLVLAMTTPGRAGKIYFNDGKGVFRDSGQLIGHRWTHAVDLGDFDGDGSPDLFLTCGEPATGTPNEVWLNDGKGGFRDSGLRLGSAFSWDAAVGDLNNDGQPDVFVANLRLVDESKSPPVFGGAPAEVWINSKVQTTK